MGLFGTLMQKIFRHSAVAERPHDARNTTPAGGGSMASPAARTATATATPVDIEPILDKLAAESDQKLDWRHSIVDLMKLVGMESSLAERKELAADLKYTGDTSDSAAMNIWLHKEVMKQLAANGGKVPASLLNH